MLNKSFVFICLMFFSFYPNITHAGPKKINNIIAQTQGEWCWIASAMSTLSRIETIREYTEKALSLNRDNLDECGKKAYDFLEKVNQFFSQMESGGANISHQEFSQFVNYIAQENNINFFIKYSNNYQELRANCYKKLEEKKVAINHKQ